MAEADQSDYEYRGLMAEAWDLLRGDTSNWPDRAFYLDLIRESGEPVLDVGCGTGRLLLDYASEGIDIDGVDNSPEMLALCREKAAAQGLELAIFEQEMVALELPRRYRTILVPSSTIQLLTDRNDALGAIRRLRDHLEPGGVLAMSFMLMGGAEEWSEWRSREAVRKDGATIRNSSRRRYDIPARLEYSEERYEVIVDGEIVATEEYSRSPSARWYTQKESRTLLEEAGFEEVRQHAQFTNDTATKEDLTWTATARRPVALKNA